MVRTVTLFKDMRCSKLADDCILLKTHFQRRSPAESSILGVLSARGDRLTFANEQKQALPTERFENPHPGVQLRMEVLWLISLGETYSNAACLAGVSEPTVDRHVAVYRQHGIEGLKQFDWKIPTSELVTHQTSLAEMFQADPRHTAAEASRRSASKHWCSCE